LAIVPSEVSNLNNRQLALMDYGSSLLESRKQILKVSKYTLNFYK